MRYAKREPSIEVRAIPRGQDMREMLTIATCVLIAAAAPPLCAQTAAKAPPAANAPAKPSRPCDEIFRACKSAGFIVGDYKEGNGLWGDCVVPIMRGTGQPSSAKVPLPQVSAETVAACKAKRPDFGEGKPPPMEGQPDQPSGK